MVRSTKLGIFLSIRHMKQSHRSAPRVVVLVAVIMVLLAGPDADAQSVLHEGLHFLAGFIHPERAHGEPLPPDAYRIVVSSRYNARVVVAGKEITVQPNASVEVVIDSCNVALVTSDKPISVASRILMPGNGEQAIQIPTFAWGMRYHAFSWWTDRYGLEKKHYAFAKRLVIAMENGTVVRVYGKSGILELKLNAGESGFVPFYLDTTGVRDSASDLTGEYYTANKPIMVISGHGKAAVLEHPDALPASGPYARAANRTRGTLMESMIPGEHAGTTFVTVPFQYSPTRKRGQDNSSVGIADDRGDVIRFIGTTTPAVLSYRTDTGDVIVDTLGQGEVYTTRSVETARVWNATRQVLCAQYGKSYGHITSQATLPEDDPSTDAGLPMMITIPSTNQWTSHALFTAPADLISYVSLVCRQQHITSIQLDGKPLTGHMYISPIAGSDVVTARAMVSPGSHVVSATRDDVTFMTITYGNLDGLQLCNAYASTCGISLQNPCIDSLEVSSEQSDDTARVTFTPVALYACQDVGLAMVYASASYNCTTSVVDGTATIRQNNATDTAYAVVTGVTLHGTSSSRRIWFGATTDVTDGLNHAQTDHLYPNPCSTTLTIANCDARSNCDVLRMCDVYGNIHVYQCSAALMHQIDVSQLPPGLYLLAHAQQTIPVMIVR